MLLASNLADGVFPKMSSAPNPQSDADQLEAAANQAIAACGGDAREAVKALIVANHFLETELEKLRAAVSTGYARGKLFEAAKTLPRDRKDWYDWAAAIFDVIERSRNVIMHSGVLDKEDIQRLGINIRDWIKQVGA